MHRADLFGDGLPGVHEPRAPIEDLPARPIQDTDLDDYGRAAAATRGLDVEQSDGRSTKAIGVEPFDHADRLNANEVCDAGVVAPGGEATAPFRQVFHREPLEARWREKPRVTSWFVRKFGWSRRWRRVWQMPTRGGSPQVCRSRRPRVRFRG